MIVYHGSNMVFSDPAALQLLKFEGSEVCG